VREFLSLATEYAVLVVNAIALIVIMAGTLEAFVRALVLMRSATGPHAARSVWLRYARWLVAGLTFQLAADIIGTSIAPTWEEIGKLGAIALIRTFLNYFLERDLIDIGKRQHEGPVRKAAA
jgi:uncharacterized membrane protein